MVGGFWDRFFYNDTLPESETHYAWMDAGLLAAHVRNFVP
eukprot:SAG22_NODE_16760_length_318_cov_1.086758_1_plen_39_part_10